MSSSVESALSAYLVRSAAKFAGFLGLQLGVEYPLVVLAAPFKVNGFVLGTDVPPATFLTNHLMLPFRRLIQMHSDLRGSRQLAGQNRQDVLRERPTTFTRSPETSATRSALGQTSGRSGGRSMSARHVGISGDGPMSREA